MNLSFWRRKRSPDDFREEIRTHLQLEADDLRAQGLGEQDARAAARHAFGNLTLAEERFYEKGRLPVVDDLIRDLRYSVATMRRAPRFTLTIVLTLALGIGLNTTIFSFANALLFRPLPVPDSDRLTAIYTSDFSGPPYGTSSYPDYADFRDGSRDVFSDVAAYSAQSMLLTQGGTAERVQGHIVTQNYFSVVGVSIGLGRPLAPGDRDAVVVSHGLWQRMLGADPAVLGRSVTINGKPFVIVGVTPESFTGLERAVPSDIWMPFEAQPESARRLTERGSRWLDVVGRLSDGVSLTQAQAAFQVIAGRLFAAHAPEWTDLRREPRRITLQPANHGLLIDRDAVLQFMTTLMVIVGVVLLLACVNVANLLLARATVRTQEMAIRLSLGAGRARLIRQLFTESVLLSILAGAAGGLLAMGSTGLLARFQPPLPVPVMLDLSPDIRILSFTVAASLVTALLFGLLPAIRTSGLDVTTALKDAAGIGGGQGPRSAALRSVLVVVQVALSVLLLVGAGLSLRSLMKAQAVDVGFTPAKVVLASISPARQGYDQHQGRAFYRQLIERLVSAPDVRAASLASNVPLSFGGSRTSVSLEGYAPRQGEDMELNRNVVSPRYFETMSIPLLQGREFTADDVEGRPGVVIVNEALVRRYWPDGKAIGKRIRRGDTDFTVVGVARDGKYRSLSEDGLPFLYLSLWQQYQPEVHVHVRTREETAAAVKAIRGVVRELDPALGIFDVRTLDDHLGIALLLPRVTTVLLGTFGALALALAVVGIYSVMAYAVSQRTREVGIRMALGAQLGDVLTLVMRQGLIIIALGMIAGAAAAVVLTRFAASLLYDVSPTDPVTFTAAIAVLAAAGSAAALIPAMRAARIHPTEALRHR